MIRSPKTAALLAVALALSVDAPQVRAQVADPDPDRFEAEFRAFETMDGKNSTPAGALLFVGSSSIRFWNTADWFARYRVINRGFGGAHISDVTAKVQETVLKYAPRTVVFYAGDNDMAAGKDKNQVLEDYQEFVDAVHSFNPATNIVWLTIKPSIARWGLWNDMQEANELVRAYSETSPRLHYVDVGTPMIGPDGEPAPHLFVADGLHMTSAGYEVWTQELRSALEVIH